MQPAAQGPTVSNTNPIILIGQGIKQGACSFIKGAKLIQSDASGFSRLIRLVGYTIAFFAPTTQLKLRSVISLTDNFVDAVQSIGSVNGLASKTKKSEIPLLRRIADVSFLAAGIGSIIQFLDAVGLAALPTVSSSTGSLGILGMVTKSVLGNAIAGVLAAAFLCMGINAGKKLYVSLKDIKVLKTQENKEIELKKAYLKRNQAILDIAWCATETAFFVLGILAVLSTTATLVLGAIAATMGIVCFLHSQQKYAEKEEIKAAY